MEHSWYNRKLDYNDKRFFKKMSQNYDSLLESGSLSDFVLVAGGKEIKAHKVVLAAGSPVFAAMFAHSTTKEAQENRVEIIDVDVEVLKVLIKYIYTGQREQVEGLEWYEAAELWEAADKYQVDCLKAICVERIISQICTESVSDIFIFADFYQELHLEQDYFDIVRRCLDFILDNGTEVMASVGWKKIIVRADLVAYLFKVLFSNCDGLDIFDYKYSDSDSDHDNEKVESKKKKAKSRKNCTFGPDFDFEKYLLNNSNVINCKQEATDMVLVVGDTELGVHKQVLSSRSSVFANMFAHDSTEENRVEMTDVNVKTLKLLIEYIYTGKIEGLDRYSKYAVSKLLEAADKYQLNSLKSICVQLLSKDITTKSVSYQVIFAYTNGVAELYNKCVDYIATNRTQVMASKGWKKVVVKTDLLTKICDRLNWNISEQQLLTPITIKSVSNLFILADMHQVSELTSKCVDYITDHVIQVIQQEDWKKVVLRADLVVMLFECLYEKYTKAMDDQNPGWRNPGWLPHWIQSLAHVQF